MKQDKGVKRIDIKKELQDILKHDIEACKKRAVVLNQEYLKYYDIKSKKSKGVEGRYKLKKGKMVKGDYQKKEGVRNKFLEKGYDGNKFIDFLNADNPDDIPLYSEQAFELPGLVKEIVFLKELLEKGALSKLEKTGFMYQYNRILQQVLKSIESYGDYFPVLSEKQEDELARLYNVLSELNVLAIEKGGVNKKGP